MSLSTDSHFLVFQKAKRSAELMVTMVCHGELSFGGIDPGVNGTLHYSWLFKLKACNTSWLILGETNDSFCCSWDDVEHADSKYCKCTNARRVIVELLRAVQCALSWKIPN